MWLVLSIMSLLTGHMALAVVFFIMYSIGDS